MSVSVSVSLSLLQARAADALGAVYIDHAGAKQDCLVYKFRITLDGYDITPRGGNGTFAVLGKRGTYADDMDKRAVDDYRYINYPEDKRGVVAAGTWRNYEVSIVATDAAGNRGEPTPFVWTIDKRIPITSLTKTPPVLSHVSRNVTFDWLSDEDGATRELAFVCQIDGNKPYACARGAKGCVPPSRPALLPWPPFLHAVPPCALAYVFCVACLAGRRASSLCTCSPSPYKHTHTHHHHHHHHHPYSLSHPLVVGVFDCTVTPGTPSRAWWGRPYLTTRRCRRPSTL